MGLNQEVRQFWEAEPCGTGRRVVGDLQTGTREWFERVEENRYRLEPFIHSVAQFTRRHGMRVLEVGVGAGTDHLQWARAGAECYGIDLTDAALGTTRAHLSIHGFQSRLQRVDAEYIPFPDNTFDVVYSWGVIHHAERPSRIVNEVRRVLKPCGEFVGMMYGRRSVAALKLWVKHALLVGKPFLGLADVISRHMESVGTKAYTVTELRSIFSEFSTFSAQPLITPYDREKWPCWLSAFFPDAWGWFITFRATK